MSGFDARYEVRNQEIEAKLKDIGHRIGGQLPKGYGFVLMLFSFGDGGDLFYISDAQRQHICNVMREFIAKYEPN